MFLTHDNKLKTKWILWGAVITFILIVMGFLGLDEFFYSIINDPVCNKYFPDEGNFWCVCASFVDDVFSTKKWLLVTGLLTLFVFAKKSVDSGIKYKDTRKRFNFIVLAKDFISKVRTNYVFLIFSSVALAALTTGILKVLIGRPRPMMLDRSFYPFIFKEDFLSMPSGHTATAFAGLVMLGMLVPKLKPYTWTIAIIVGLSRVYVGVHWPSDVLLGAFIGMVSADLVKWFVFKRK